MTEENDDLLGQVIEEIDVLDPKGETLSYSITHYSAERQHPYRASWHSTIGMTSPHRTLGGAQRWIIGWNERFGGPALQFQRPQFQRRLSHPKFGKGTLVEEVGDKCVIDFDDAGRRTILTNCVEFEEEK